MVPPATSTRPLVVAPDGGQGAPTPRKESPVACGKPCECESYRAHLLSVGFAASAMPSRKGTVADTEAREKVLTKDMDAYKRLRGDGLQPQRIDGSHHLEQGAVERAEVERGILREDVPAWS